MPAKASTSTFLSLNVTTSSSSASPALSPAPPLSEEARRHVQRRWLRAADAWPGCRVRAVGMQLVREARPYQHLPMKERLLVRGSPLEALVSLLGSGSFSDLFHSLNLQAALCRFRPDRRRWLGQLDMLRRMRAVWALHPSSFFAF